MNEGGLTARHGPVGRFWVGRPAGHRPLTHPNGWVSGCRAGQPGVRSIRPKVRLVDMGASAHLRWVTVVAAASLAAAVPAVAQEPASPDAAPSGSHAPRPDPAPVKTKPRVVVRAAPRPVATVTTTTVGRRRPRRRRRRPKPRASKPRAPGDDPPQASSPPRKARRARPKPRGARVALPALPHLTLAQLSAPSDHRRRRPRTQARRRRPVAADPRAGERDAAGVHRAGRAQAGGAMRRALLLAVVGLAVWAPAAVCADRDARRRWHVWRQRLVCGQRRRQLDDHAHGLHR